MKRDTIFFQINMRYIFLLLLFVLSCTSSNDNDNDDDDFDEDDDEPVEYVSDQSTIKLGQQQADSIVSELSVFLNLKITRNGCTIQVDGEDINLCDSEILTYKPDQIIVKWKGQTGHAWEIPIEKQARDRVIVLLCEFIALNNGTINLTPRYVF